jgi:hypothetical protein
MLTLGFVKVPRGYVKGNIYLSLKEKAFMIGEKTPRLLSPLAVLPY